VALAVAQLVQQSDRLFTGIFGERPLSGALSLSLLGELSSSTAKNYEIEQRVGTETVGTVDRGAGSFTS